MRKWWKIEEGKKIRVSTYSSDFEGTVDTYEQGWLQLKDAEEVYDYLWHYGDGDYGYEGRREERRKSGRIMIPDNEIEHYEFLEDIEDKAFGRTLGV